jgi:Flp pilus assembly pilin Flp
VSIEAAVRDKETSRFCDGKEMEMIDLVHAKLQSEEGQALIEYALILTLITLLAVGGLTVIGNKLGPFYSTISSAINF